ncbi:hypothetical protein NC653_021632 [Populus alba x Populus x berolinensis]|uniref:Uncharacterized protein n=1 Tax=Populus alba x Populus x berolinensis TaxID=444605 RepID=A0AAD6MQ14_9ROSI|nr:hypothetical protein NC653_021632 [Populus alba x Populus x berolinensis]
MTTEVCRVVGLPNYKQAKKSVLPFLCYLQMMNRPDFLQYPLRFPSRLEISSKNESTGATKRDGRRI